MSDKPQITLIVNQADESKELWGVTVLTQYDWEGSDGMAAVEAIADIRKSWPNDQIVLMVFEDGEVHTTKVQPVLENVEPIQ